MIRNYFRSAWRNMKRSKLYTIINLFCLTVGISGAIIIALYLNHELSFDSHHSNHESIYRLHGNYIIGGNPNELAITPFPLGPALKQEFSPVKEYVRFFHIEEATIKIEDRTFFETSLMFADTTVFDVFTHHFIYGNPNGALAQPNTAVLTKSFSEKLFGQGNPIDKVVEINDRSFRVTAMIEDVPDNTHLRFDGLLSIHSAGNDFAYSLEPMLFWSINTNFTYIQMHQGTDIYSVLDNMEGFNEKYVAEIGSMIGATAQFLATPLRKTHFTPLNMAPETGSRSTLMIFTIVAVFLIIIAAVNYTNLATARASNRAREIAMRKVSGASRKQLIFQFLAESLIVASVALLLSLLLVELFLPGFNALANKSFSLGLLFEGNMIVQVLLITAFTGLIAGIYPAIFLSRLKPVSILKSNLQSKGGSGLLRKMLVVFQFTISVILIAGTLTVHNQLSYLQNKDLGFEKANRMVVTLSDMQVRERIETLENMILENPMVVRTTKSTQVPGRGTNLHAVKIQSADGIKDATISSSYIDHRFLDLMGINLRQGRGFHAEQRSDVNASILINEAAVRTFGWQDDPLGKIVYWLMDEQGEPRYTFRVIGVINDFNYTSLHNPIEPMMLRIPERPELFRAIIVEYMPGNHQQVKAFLENSVREFDPGHHPNVQALDYGFQEQFSAEERLGNIFGIFSIVCIAISFLGLFGLSSFTTGQRRKEIGIRKVLGSSGWSILGMFYKEFSLLILAAIIIAAPITWLLMDRWLQGFVYSIDMSISPILFSGLLSVAVAMLTVSYHIFMASRMNPTDAIRSE